MDDIVSALRWSFFFLSSYRTTVAGSWAIWRRADQQSLARPSIVSRPEPDTPSEMSSRLLLVSIAERTSWCRVNGCAGSQVWRLHLILIFFNWHMQLQQRSEGVWRRFTRFNSVWLSVWLNRDLEKLWAILLCLENLFKPIYLFCCIVGLFEPFLLSATIITSFAIWPKLYISK